MAMRMRGAVVASSGFAALLVACLLSASGPNLASAQWDWTSQLLPNYKAQAQTVMRLAAISLNQTYYSRFTQLFASYFKSGDLVIDQDATILIPTNGGLWRCPKARNFYNLTRNQKLRFLRYHILKGRYLALDINTAAPNTLFPTFNQNLPLNKTSNTIWYTYLDTVPQRVVANQGYRYSYTGVEVPNAGLVKNIAAQGVSWCLDPPNL
ncbi:unnamed protein product [Closterium sp. Naga37s-1]|nr:unnamed protein product [Closterium sp. Naga37s-1]